MYNNRKRELILDAMQNLMAENSAKSISVSDIAKKAGIGKGSIYYYFKSKEKIVEAVMERAYSSILEQGKKVVSSSEIDALTKMKIIFQTCRQSSLELQRQESNDFFGIQQRALFHQKFVNISIKNLKEILTNIIKQGISEHFMQCEFPEDVAEIVLIVLTIKLDNHILISSEEENKRFLINFASILEDTMKIEKGKLDFLYEEK